MKKLLFSFLVLGITSVLAIGATTAYFSDTEISTGNTFVAGTLNLQVGGLEGAVVPMVYSKLQPGFDSGYTVYCLKNTGSLPGQPYVEFSQMINNDNGIFGPEAVIDQTGGDGQGELGQYLKYTIGVGPCGWSVPNLLISQWQTGPQHPWGIPGLNELSGNQYFKGPTGYKFPVLNQNDTYGFFIKVSLDDNIKTYTGTGWIEQDDNIIQSDSVAFNLMFHLEQVQ